MCPCRAHVFRRSPTIGRRYRERDNGWPLLLRSASCPLYQFLTLRLNARATPSSAAQAMAGASGASSSATRDNSDDPETCPRSASRFLSPPAPAMSRRDVSSEPVAPTDPARDVLHASSMRVRDQAKRLQEKIDFLQWVEQHRISNRAADAGSQRSTIEVSQMDHRADVDGTRKERSYSPTRSRGSEDLTVQRHREGTRSESPDVSETVATADVDIDPSPAVSAMQLLQGERLQQRSSVVPSGASREPLITEATAESRRLHESGDGGQLRTRMRLRPFVDMGSEETNPRGAPVARPVSARIRGLGGHRSQTTRSYRDVLLSRVTETPARLDVTPAGSTARILRRRSRSRESNGSVVSDISDGDLQAMLHAEAQEIAFRHTMREGASTVSFLGVAGRSSTQPPRRALGGEAAPSRYFAVHGDERVADPQQVVHRGGTVTSGVLRNWFRDGQHIPLDTIALPGVLSVANGGETRVFSRQQLAGDIFETRVPLPPALPLVLRAHQGTVTQRQRLSEDDTDISQVTEMFPTFSVEQGATVCGSTSCPICLEPLIGEILLLPCLCTGHQRCMKDAINADPRCPLHRIDVREQVRNPDANGRGRLHRPVGDGRISPGDLGGSTGEEYDTRTRDVAESPGRTIPIWPPNAAYIEVTPPPPILSPENVSQPGRPDPWSSRNPGSGSDRSA